MRARRGGGKRGWGEGWGWVGWHFPLGTAVSHPPPLKPRMSSEGVQDTRPLNMAPGHGEHVKLKESEKTETRVPRTSTRSLTRLPRHGQKTLVCGHGTGALPIPGGKERPYPQRQRQPRRSQRGFAKSPPFITLALTCLLPHDCLLFCKTPHKPNCSSGSFLPFEVSHAM